MEKHRAERRYKEQKGDIQSKIEIHRAERAEWRYTEQKEQNGDTQSRKEIHRAEWRYTE